LTACPSALPSTIEAFGGRRGIPFNGYDLYGPSSQLASASAQSGFSNPRCKRRVHLKDLPWDDNRALGHRFSRPIDPGGAHLPDPPLIFYWPRFRGQAFRTRMTPDMAALLMGLASREIVVGYATADRIRAPI